MLKPDIQVVYPWREPLRITITQHTQSIGTVRTQIWKCQGNDWEARCLSDHGNLANLITGIRSGRVALAHKPRKGDLTGWKMLRLFSPRQTQMKKPGSKLEVWKLI